MRLERQEREGRARSEKCGAGHASPIVKRRSRQLDFSASLSQCFSTHGADKAAPSVPIRNRLGEARSGRAEQTPPIPRPPGGSGAQVASICRASSGNDETGLRSGDGRPRESARENRVRGRVVRPRCHRNCGSRCVHASTGRRAVGRGDPRRRPHAAAYRRCRCG